MPISVSPLRPLPVHLDTPPTVLIIFILHLRTRLQPPLRHANHQATLKHKRTAPRTHFRRLQLCIRRTFKALRIRAMPTHHVMQTRAPRYKPTGSALFRIVPALNQPHELTHGIPVVPRRTKRVLAHQPPRRENHKVRDRGARRVGQRAQHRENGRVWVVERHGADGVEAAQVILVRVVHPMPRHHVERSVPLSRRIQAVGEFGRHRVLRGSVESHSAAVLVEARHGRLEIARIGEAVGSKRPELGEREVALVQLEGIAANWGGAVGEVHGEFEASWDDGDLHGPHEKPAQFGADVERALLRDKQEVAVGRVESLGGAHGLARGKDIHAQAGFQGGVARAGNEVQSGDEVGVFGGMLERVPADLRGKVVELCSSGLFEVDAACLSGLLVTVDGLFCSWLEGRVCAGRQDAV